MSRQEERMKGVPSEEKPWLEFYDKEAIEATVFKGTMWELLYQNNKEYVDDIALIYYGHEYTYKQLFENISRASKAFSELGVKKGDIVIMCTVNTPEMVYALYGLNCLGAIANMIDPRTNVSGIREYIMESQAALIITVDSMYDKIQKATEGTEVRCIIAVSPAESIYGIPKVLYRIKNGLFVKKDSKKLTWKEFIDREKEERNTGNRGYEENTCAIIAHTGGTTGTPKSVMLSNENVNSIVHNYKCIDIPIERGQRYFNDLPPFIMYGLCFALHTALCLGLKVILYPVFDSRKFPKQFKKYMPNHFCALPDHLRYLASTSVSASLNLAQLITVGVGGDSLDNKLEREVNQYLKEHNCKYQVFKGYGMTELSATAISSCVSANAIGSIGIPLILNTVKIVDCDSLEEVGYNQTGEIWISGPSVMMGYLKNEIETEKTIVKDKMGNSWIRTGDLGYMTPEGLIYHRGRIRRIYMTAYKGQPAKIFPLLVEEVCKNVQGVKECCVVGKKRENSDYYEAVAFIVKEDNLIGDVDIVAELGRMCKKSLPTYMIPAKYHFIDELPRTAIGKVDFCNLEKKIAE